MIGIELTSSCLRRGSTNWATSPFFKLGAAPRDELASRSLWDFLGYPAYLTELQCFKEQKIWHHYGELNSDYLDENQMSWPLDDSGI